jgi:NodT family efflux transporter outer membrane factor (OMF) lipoprotein
MTPVSPNAWLAGFVAIAIGGCAAGPDFHKPEAPKVATYTPVPLPDNTATAPGRSGVAQHLATGAEVSAQWWALFHSEPLDRLIREALANSPSLAAAQARLRQAQENLRAETGAVSPSVDARLSAQRQRFSPAAMGQPNAPSYVFDLFNASVGVSYTFDAAGGWWRELEAMQAQVDYQNFQLEAAHLTLTANVVTTAIREASIRAQMTAVTEILTTQRKQLDVVDRQHQLGGAALADVLAQRTQLAQTQATLLPLEKELASMRHLLAVLTGRFPGEVQLPEFTLESLELPAELPVSVPSALVRQRPDIRAAESLWHQASAQVGVATANQYPRITLSGSYGSQANEAGDLFTGRTGVWSIGAALLQPIFHAGELSARRRAAVAAYDQSEALYRETVLRAFQNVADTLRALDVDARLLAALSEVESVARETLDLTQKQYALGGSNYLSLLNAERQYQQARINFVQAQAARYADSAALFQALGGGWWNRPVPDDKNDSPERKPEP